MLSISSADYLIICQYPPFLLGALSILGQTKRQESQLTKTVTFKALPSFSAFRFFPFPLSAIYLRTNVMEESLFYSSGEVMIFLDEYWYHSL